MSIRYIRVPFAMFYSTKKTRLRSLLSLGCYFQGFGTFGIYLNRQNFITTFCELSLRELEGNFLFLPLPFLASAISLDAGKTKSSTRSWKTTQNINFWTTLNIITNLFTQNLDCVTSSENSEQTSLFIAQSQTTIKRHHSTYVLFTVPGSVHLL